MVVKSRGEGDSVFAVFARASDAVAAAIDLQRVLQARAWPTEARLRVRMALHTGEAELRAGDYYGVAVNRCARLRAAEHGGQILLSGATRDLLERGLPAGVGLRDLGEHRRTAVRRPERVFQVVIPGLPADFPPLRSLDTLPNNLPRQLTSFIGREAEIELARSRLLRDDVHLLTLTGPGGTGKTRMALHLARLVADYFPDGVVFVALAPVQDPRLVASAIAQELGLQEAGNRPLQESLKDWLRDKRLLLVLDNFEHILAAAPLVADLLATCPRLKVLVTSRAVLHLTGEHQFSVPPLRLPDRAPLPPLERLSRYEAVQLFIARAQSVKADFAVTSENAPAVAEICHRLDGLPLAIELAATRIRLLPPRAILARLEHRLPLLTGGPRDLPARQQTLRDTIAWSYDLLDEAEQRLFRRLAIFVGGCTLESVARVCDPGGDLEIDVLEGIGSLVDKSLIHELETATDEPRFMLLETLREYGLDELVARGEEAALRAAHAAYFLELAEAADAQIRGPRQRAWLDRLETEHDNLRAALTWSLGEAGDPEQGVRLAGALAWFWRLHGHISEGRRWLAEALRSSADRPTLFRSRALTGAGLLAYAQGDYPAARSMLEESLRLARQFGDAQRIGWALHGLGRVVTAQGDYAAAAQLLDESLTTFRATGDSSGRAYSLMFLGNVARDRGDYDRAATLYRESVALARQAGDTWGLSFVLAFTAELACLQGDLKAAGDLYREGLARAREIQARWAIAHCLRGLTGVAGSFGQAERAARLFGAEQALCETIGTPPVPGDDAAYRRGLEAARAALGGPVFAALAAEGRTLPLDQVIADALTADAPPAPPPVAATSERPHAGDLTAREVEVLRLLASGRTNKEIANELVIAVPTVERHISNLYAKIGARGRAEAATYALRHGVVPATEP